MLVRLKDEHPGRWHAGVVVKLARAHCPSFSPRPFLTGFRPFDIEESRGMFSPTEEPVQVIRSSGPYTWWFTASNCTSISRAEIDVLFAEGKLHIERGSFVLDISLL